MPKLQKIVYVIILFFSVFSGTGAAIGAINDSVSFFTFKRAITISVVVCVFAFIVFFVARYWGIKWKHDKNSDIITYTNFKWSIWIICIAIITEVWTGYFFSINNEISAKPQKVYSLTCNFPNVYNKDTLYILITRFEPDANKVETACFGRALRDRIDAKVNELKIPIRICYSDSLYPKTHTEAKEFQKKYFADLVLWGDISNVVQNCSSGDFCFSSQPSDSLIKTAGGKVDIETNKMKFQHGMSPDRIREGNFEINFGYKAYKFDKWLNTVYNIKVGGSNPNLYVIDENLPNIEKKDDYLQRANLFFKLNNLTRALLDYDKVIKLDSKNYIAYANRAIVNEYMGNQNKALFDFNKAILYKPAAAELYYDRGLLKSKLGDKNGALNDYNQAVKLFSNNPLALSSAYNNRGSIKIASKDTLGGIADYDVALKYDSNSILAYYNRGITKSSIGKYVEAIRDFDEVLKKQPNYLNAYIDKGIAESLLGNRTAAIGNYDKVLKLDPINIRAYYCRGNAKALLGRKNDAIVDYDKVIKLDPNYEPVYCNRGNLKYQIGDTASAIKDYNKSIEINPNQVSAYYNRGLAYADLGKYNYAIGDYDKALQFDPNSAVTYNNRGTAKMKIGNQVGGIQDFKKALQINPQLKEAKTNLEIYKKEQSRKKKHNYLI